MEVEASWICQASNNLHVPVPKDILQEATTWEQLPAQLRGRRIHHTKKWLNSRAVERMTPALLRERDPDGEILSWLRTIQQMAEDD